VICGLGGSGIGAKIVSNWIQDEIQVPVVVNNEYVLPAFAGKNTLVIGSSYSGNTEESTSSINEAHEKGCHIIGITSGGNLASFCATNGYDCVIVPGGNPPRSALAGGWHRIAFFHKVWKANIFNICSDAISCL
jgi:glucose/mannose-6-phosphate isomerase